MRLYWTDSKTETKSGPQIIRMEPIADKPMTVDEAVMQIDYMKNKFLVFRNVQSDEINVLYKRKDGALGLVVPEIPSGAPPRRRRRSRRPPTPAPTAPQPSQAAPRPQPWRPATPAPARSPLLREPLTTCLPPDRPCCPSRRGGLFNTDSLMYYLLMYANSQVRSQAKF